MTSFDALYAHVPREQRDALKAFRENHPLQYLTVAGTEWTYHTAGTGEDTILWLVGGLKKADAAYKSIPQLADHYRIIAPDYPALGTMQALADGLAALLKVEDVQRVYVLAGSFGGMLAQVFMRHYPAMIEKVVLSTTSPPNPSHAERYQQLLDMATIAPDALLAETAQSQMFGTIAPADEEAEFYRAYLKELYENRLTKTDIVTIYQAILDYMGKAFSDSDLADWGGEILIINSDNDATFGESVQDNLVNLYPTAQVHTFKGAGHSPASTQREAFFKTVKTFFTR